MRKYVFLITVITVFFSRSLAQSTVNALFLGNSYTYFNNLPLIINNMAVSTGDTLIFDSNTPGGYTLKNHSTNPTTLAKIMQGGWDFVVLQEQSQLPSLPDTIVEKEVLPYARFLDSLINVYNPCCETMFFMTWGRKNGDATNCPWWPPVCTYEGMDGLLRLRYLMLADSSHAVVSPAGAVWRYIRQHYPYLELYSPDESHPSEAGSYAAACGFYASMFRKNPGQVTYNFTLSSGDAAMIREAAGPVVFDSLSFWHTGEYDPVAGFAFVSLPDYMVTFNNLSENASDYFWDFGDGNSSAETDPVHVYSSPGEYTVKLTASWCGFSDTCIQPVNATLTGSEIGRLEKSMRVYPNPFTDRLYFDINEQDLMEFFIYDALGKRYYPVCRPEGNKIGLLCEALPPGVYFLNLLLPQEFLSCRVVKIADCK